jgi:hypothetical protein
MDTTTIDSLTIDNDKRMLMARKESEAQSNFMVSRIIRGLEKDNEIRLGLNEQLLPNGNKIPGHRISKWVSKNKDTIRGLVEDAAKEHEFKESIKQRLHTTLSKGVEEGIDDAVGLLVGQGVDVDFESVLDVASINREILNTHIRDRFPFRRREDRGIWEEGVSFDTLPGEEPEGYGDREYKIRPGPNDYRIGYRADKDEGEGLSPNLNNRVDRTINDLLGDSHSLVSESMRALSDVRSIPGGISEKRESLIPATVIGKTISGKMKMLFVSERNRAYQRAVISLTAKLGIKFVKWNLRSGHGVILGKYKMVRDWCDDIACTPIEVSLRRWPEQIKALRDWNETGFFKDAKKGKTSFPIEEGPVDIINKENIRKVTLSPLVGIFNSVQIVQRKIPTIVYKWNFSKGVQIFYDRVERELFVPPHPFCSCIMIPLFNSKDVEGSTRGGKAGEEMRNRLLSLENQERAADIEQGMASGEMSDSVLLALLADMLESDDLAKVYMEPVKEYGTDAVFLPPEVVIELPERQVA